MTPRPEEGKVDEIESQLPPQAELTTKSLRNHDSDTGVSNSDDDVEEEQHLFRFMKGIKEDLAARGPLYLDDWGWPKNIFTVINATIFAFVIQLIPALIFAELMDRQTDGNLATGRFSYCTRRDGFDWLLWCLADERSEIPR